MARRYMHVSCNGVHVRTFGGNGQEVRNMYAYYKHMTKEEFLRKHPWLTKICKDSFCLSVYYSGDHRTCEIHIVDRKNKDSVVESGFENMFEANLWALKNLPESEVHLWGQEFEKGERFRYFVSSGSYYNITK